MERFNFNVEMNYDVQHEPLVNQVQFGDNYSQRTSKGINSDLCKYSNLRIICDADVKHQIDTFLKSHGGHKSFLWRSKTENRDVKVFCPSWSYRENGAVFEFTLNFIETL
ncbi:TPA: phage tail protein [Pasteurella multocida]|uniref:Phage tail protein n=1 Tax=Pasteurella multocida TaxID=747 RepID=A0A849CR14_PASMD|nr:phage tail protein [Pasteurella multocida]AFF23366.1 Gifsy-1 prophage VmtM [Pasteurella multocida subsp. multocida str. HN06]AON58439.1 hypothetical protein AZI96_06755 [Pasteurella multocida]ARA88398.1 hypothetical protein BTV66_01650 [Pasteurella multocida subsp. septica]AUK28634.1 hypothetical protein A4205_08145 [Pasteurella multocida]AUK33875.1 hypothetical protein A4201_02935 [Pasteurella multocida]